MQVRQTTNNKVGTVSFTDLGKLNLVVVRYF
jgi:hypothetical protein